MLRKRKIVKENRIFVRVFYNEISPTLPCKPCHLRALETCRRSIQDLCFDINYNKTVYKYAVPKY